VNDTTARMDDVLGPPHPETLERIAGTSPAWLNEYFGHLAVAEGARRELVDHWASFQREPAFCRLLAQLLTVVERDRGDSHAPIPIWEDLDDLGTSGRLLYYYLFALATPGLLHYYDDLGVPLDVVTSSLSALERHAETHRLKWGTYGVDAGWWMLPILRGEILQIGSLKFHRFDLGEGVLTPEPWYDAAEQERRGPGFRYGDQSIGIHIPARIDISPAALDATLARAREVLAVVWPATCRRLATCESWMMDDRLPRALGPSSRIVAFQQRFELLPTWRDDRANVLEFVFRQPGTALEDLVPQSRLQSFIRTTLASGEWQSRIGWFDFDGVTS